MNLHEYQAKEYLAAFGIPTPPFVTITSILDLDHAFEILKTDEVVIKAQVHAGGRGKAGGVKIAKNKKEAADLAFPMLGMRLKNQQTGEKGLLVEKVLISPLVNFEKEYYLAVTIDREKAQAILIASPHGGMDIEEISEKNPESLLIMSIPSDGKLRNYHVIEIGKFMEWKDKLLKEGHNLIQNLIDSFFQLDASLIEINPLVLMSDQTLLALDAKCSIDENALYRHPKILEQFDYSQISALEVAAKKADLAYIPLEGTIGCMVNGAGLAMATMDIIEFYGGKPANFLDVGGGASQEKIATGFKIILSDPKVKAIFINIFGGILNCETLAKGIIAAAKEQEIKVPLIVRMEGTNVEKGKKLLSESGLKIQIASTLAEAAMLSCKEGENGHSH